MKRMRDYFFTELGYFSQETCEKVKKAMEGRTYMHFEVNYSISAGNCTLIISTDYEGTEAEIKNLFLACCLCCIAG